MEFFVLWQGSARGSCLVATALDTTCPLFATRCSRGMEKAARGRGVNVPHDRKRENYLYQSLALTMMFLPGRYVNVSSLHVP